jgi:hypothetical protein
MIMKTRTILALALGLALVHPSSANADDLFQMFWRGTFYVTDANGNLFHAPFTEQSFINRVAKDNGLDPSTLLFVYRADKRDTAVVAANGKFIADVIQIGLIDSNTGFFDLPNAAGTQIIRHALLFDEAHQDPIGSAVGSEAPVRDANGNLVSTSFSGIFEFAYPEKNIICFGTFSTGRRVVDTTNAP